MTAKSKCPSAILQIVGHQAGPGDGRFWKGLSFCLNSARVALRAWWALKDKRALLNPLRYGVFAWQLWSHKLLRYLGPVFQLVVLGANVALAFRSSSWRVLLGAQALFYAAAIYRHLDRRHALPGLVNLAYYLCIINLASGAALLQFLAGRKKVTWNPRT